LYLSPRAVLQPGTAIRGGIPVCWPWFGPHPHDGGLPAHGFARICRWTLELVREDDDGVEVQLDLRDSDTARACWPHPFRLNLTVHIGAELAVVLTTHNPGPEPLRIGNALHTYLRVGDITHTRIEGLDGAGYLDSLIGENRQQTGPVEFDREVDRVYRHGGGCRLLDEARGCAVTVQKSGAKDLVVWNPWVEKSGTMRDLPPDGFREFVCIEAANVDGDLPCVPPGGIQATSTCLQVV
jgi:glucose-6-phosphate 1-epimerase